MYMHVCIGVWIIHTYTSRLSRANVRGWHIFSKARVSQLYRVKTIGRRLFQNVCQIVAVRVLVGRYIRGSVWGAERGAHLYVCVCVCVKEREIEKERERERERERKNV